MKPLNLLCLTCAFVAMLAVTGCGGGVKADNPHVPPPTLVSVIQCAPADVPIYSEYSAQTFARDTVEVRGRVDGFIQKRLFAVGSDVQPGQVLYELDRRPYEAEVAKAKGDLDQSLSSLEFAKNQVALVQAKADLAQKKARVDLLSSIQARGGNLGESDVHPSIMIEIEDRDTDRGCARLTPQGF